MLVPMKVTITGSFKAFGFRDGLSSGSDVQIEFHVPEGMTALELKKEIVRQKFTLDTMAMRAELAKGMLPKELFDEIHARYRKHSEAVIHGYDEADKQTSSGT